MCLEQSWVQIRERSQVLVIGASPFGQDFHDMEIVVVEMTPRVASVVVLMKHSL
jgi:hypothetical protein